MDASGAADGITARNYGIGALSITTTGTVTGTNDFGIFARNNLGGTDLTIEAADVSGGLDGILTRQYGTGALSITATGTMTGTSGTGINATNDRHGSDDRGGGCDRWDDRHLCQQRWHRRTDDHHHRHGDGDERNRHQRYQRRHGSDDHGGGCDRWDDRHRRQQLRERRTVDHRHRHGNGDDVRHRCQQFRGALSIATTGTVIGTSNVGINARNGSCDGSCSPATDLTIAAADVSGGTYGIQARNFGSGVLSITATGTVTGTDAGILARSGTYTYRYGTDLTIVAAGVTGGTTGIDAD